MKEPVETAGFCYRGFDLSPIADDITAWDLSTPCPTAAKADVAMLLDVLEHCWNPGLALRHVAGALHPRGWLIMTMPNPRWSRSRIHALLSGYPACFTQSDLDLNGHVFTPWPHVVARMLADADFEIVDYVTLDGCTQWPGRPVTLRYPLRCLHACANKLIERFDSSACGMSYGLLARRCGNDPSPRAEPLL